MAFLLRQYTGSMIKYQGDCYMCKLKKLVVCVDMAGCPNRCKHCWISVTPNRIIPVKELVNMAKAFRTHTNSLEIISWYREPDFRADYKELWELENKLSDIKTPHFELMSYWRIVRDDSYVKWLYSLGVRNCQLTLFGKEETTDYFVGRKGAYKEIIRAIDILLAHGIAPRLQIFVNQKNMEELPYIEKLITDMNLINRCHDIGQSFQVFVHQGSCDGENEKFYHSWILESDLTSIPTFLAESSKKFFHKNTIKEVFGETEYDLYKQLSNATEGYPLIGDSPVFYVDINLEVYPNISGPAPWWSLGNLKKDGAKQVIDNYIDGRFYANRYLQSNAISELVRRHGDFNSLRLFHKSDYIVYLINQGCKQDY